MSKSGPIVPILAGAGGALVAVVGADKLGVNPGVAAWGTAAVGAATALGTTGIVRDVATGVGAAGMCLGALQLFASAKAEAAKKAAAAHKAPVKRQADGDYITRDQLNDALSHMADQQQKGHCDLLSALDDIRKIVANAEQQPSRSDPASLPAPGTRTVVDPAKQDDPSSRTPIGVAPTTRREARADDYERNAYGSDEERNAYVDEERNAFADEERNAYGDDYERNAYGSDEERNAYVDEERNAFADEERNAYVDEERNADGEA